VLVRLSVLVAPSSGFPRNIVVAQFLAVTECAIIVNHGDF
jgi:hypothetical protein